MPRITRESLLTLEAYAKARKDFRAQVIAHKKARTVHLGEHVTLLFEDELTIRYQVQEMLRIEKTFEEAGIAGRARRLQPARPGRLELQGDDADRVRGRRGAQARRSRRCAASRRASGCRSRAAPRVDAIADEDLPRENDEKTAAVHFLRFELTPEMVAALKYGVGLADRRRPSRVHGRDPRGRRGDAQGAGRRPRVGSGAGCVARVERSETRVGGAMAAIARVSLAQPGLRVALSRGSC